MAAETPTPPRPDGAPDPGAPPRRGRLKVYMGYAPGVGKTWHLLQDAHALRGRGVDVAVGLVEPRGRPPVEALLGGLEVLPRRRYEHRGVGVEELDVDAILARAPQVAVVDDAAHVNAPPCRNRRRYQDILELLAAGIGVICAFDVRHLESLNDLLERVAQLVVRERIPDRFLRQADQVVSVDLTVEDLLERLGEGRIYPQPRASQARDGLFQERVLASLRELALREVAESLDRSAAALAPAAVDAPRGGAAGRVMVCMSSISPIGPVLLRRGSRMAGRLNLDWFVVYAEPASQVPDLLSPEAQGHLQRNIELARELGAEVVRLKAADPVAALIDFARSHGVGHILIGRSHQAAWRQRLGLSFDHRMLREASGFDLHIVTADEPERAP